MKPWAELTDRERGLRAALVMLSLPALFAAVLIVVLLLAR